MVVRRGKKAGNNKLPDPEAGARRTLLRENIRHHQGMGMLLRQVQVDPVQGRCLRPLRRRGHALQGAPGAGRPHRARLPGGPYLVLPFGSFAHGTSPGPDGEHAEIGSLLREDTSSSIPVMPQRKTSRRATSSTRNTYQALIRKIRRHPCLRHGRHRHQGTAYPDRPGRGIATELRAEILDKRKTRRSTRSSSSGLK